MTDTNKLKELLAETLEGAKKVQQENLVTNPRDFAEKNIQGVAFSIGMAGPMPPEDTVPSVLKSFEGVTATEEQYKTAIAWLSAIGGQQLVMANQFFDDLKRITLAFKQLTQAVIGIELPDDANEKEKAMLADLKKEGAEVIKFIDERMAGYNKIDKRRAESRAKKSGGVEPETNN